MIKFLPMERSRLIEQLAEHIDRLQRPHPTRIAIDGIDAAGKTSLANELVLPLQERGRRVIRAGIDGFHNPRAVRYRRGKNSPEGYYRDSFDISSLVTCLLEPLGPGGSLMYRTATFDFHTDTTLNLPLKRAPVDAVLLFDGVFLSRPELHTYWDYVIYLHVSFETSVVRARQRDQRLLGEAKTLESRYWQRYMPGQRLYLDECQPQHKADLLLDNNNFTRPVVLRFE